MPVGNGGGFADGYEALYVNLNRMARHLENTPASFMDKVRERRVGGFKREIESQVAFFFSVPSLGWIPGSDPCVDSEAVANATDI